MTRKQTIADLIAKVEAGEPNRNDGTLYALFGDNWVNAWDVIDRGSLDAAKAMHEAALPDNCYWWVERRPDGQFQSGVTVGNLGKTFQSFSDNPARSWLLAILRALHAQQGD